MAQPVSFRGIFETESIAGKRAKESFITVVSFEINESLAGTMVESGPFCAKETPAEIKKTNAKKTNRFK
jgi:hypothetical protein